MPTLYSFLVNKSMELGAEHCGNCGRQDASFGLGIKGKFEQNTKSGYCIWCKSPVKTYPKVKTLQYCFEVYKEVFLNYNDRAHQDDKQMAKQMIDDILSEIKSNNNLPSNEKILKFQSQNIYLCRLGAYAIGSPETMGGYVIIQDAHVFPKLEENFLKLEGDAYAIAIACLCINYILYFEVANEFILSTVTKKSVQHPILENFINKKKGNKIGCLGVILLTILIGTAILFIV